MKKREHRDYLFDIINSIKEIESFIDNITYEDFMKDRKTSNAVIRSIEIIGEATKQIPKSIKDKNPSIPWKRMAGMRDKMIHEYFGIDYDIVWKSAKETLPKLKDKIVAVINEEEI